MSTSSLPVAPELAVSQWFNTPTPLTLAGLRGRPVFLHSFQLLCPGCVSQAIPQVQRLERVFAQSDLQIIGLHTVFEHHAAMTPVTLQAFLHEYRLRSPVGVDLAEDGSNIPVTMRRYGLRGTPSSVLIGRDGTILHQIFGVEDDIALGARVAMALAAPLPERADQPAGDDGCADGRCAIPDAAA
ncbi:MULTISPECIES: redoxin family protein [unclassified Rhizobium]|uniref:redoxin family protein n=1 Tax=unclassified Rhizobium TaxID=2613769 RepID=UPI00071411A2|nr:MULTISPECIES: redoxin family protein [unclassified Rhizobium]KQS83213.1 alkyl hydroperoxide reductase [Rhizobium sp. Leaf386]KQS88900.1 alkyl hydroperoxide reductase [Rhizobium sp. Leaf391]KQT92748.1 alkyl hydroperoxide reductase [Rhizobium sp. Leaf453]